MSDRWFVSAIWLVPALPLLAAIMTAISGKRWLGEKSHLPCLIASAASAVLSLTILFSVATISDPTEPAAATAERPAEAQPRSANRVVYSWISTGDLQVNAVLRVDPLTCLMLVMVTVVGSLIVLYASGYMHGDPGYWRFFTYVSMFLFSMTMLVLASNFLLLFVFWEAVGLCSYLLIGFWFQKPAAAAAAKKAFLVNRIGDFGFALGIILVWLTFAPIAPAPGYGNLDYEHAFANLDAVGETTNGQGTLLIICLLLFCGAVGKSAQFPLHVWLPDAMEGPTPVSALIHAATMVTAGVYMVARLSPLFFASPPAQLVVASIGGITALIAALIALTQNDLKRILAYSTVSQLGYMFLALGCGSVFAVVAGVFHVFTHAFFKALLFLGAGSVMHAMGNVTDIRRFSGLRNRLPITCWTFAAGAASLAGLPLLSGFWSKDEILAAVLQRSRESSMGMVYGLLLVMGILTAFLTAFYTFRAFFKTFWGAERIPEEAGDHAHESPPVMYYPLIILASFAILLGLVIGPTGAIAKFLSHTPGLTDAHEHHLNFVLMIISGAVAVAGSALAWVFYGMESGIAESMAARFRAAYQFSLNRMWFDELYARMIVKPILIAALLAKVFDKWIVDGLVQAVAYTPAQVARVLFRPLQNGLVQFYALGMVLGIVMLALAMWMS